MDDVTLLPCPFCGDPMKHSVHEEVIHVDGDDCIIGKNGFFVTEWNRRTPASDGRAEGLREAAEICRLNAVQSVSNDAMPEPVGDACWSHVGQKYAAMILARAAELEGKTDE
jgi:hypothetical protein